MAKDGDTSGSGGLGLCAILFLIFLVLKLCAVIDWSWWWVTAPLWGPVAFCVAGLIALLLFAGVFRLMRWSRGK